ncbi:MAG: GTP-binding protein, partial [Ignisphaera sp.]
IKNIPIGIIEAFRAVLEEISDADVVLLVIDGSKVLDQVEIELKTSLNILKDIGALGKPLIIALNKIDVANDANISDIVELIKINTNEYKTQLIDVITISALKRYNIDLLKDALCRTVQQVQRNLV